MEPLLLVGLDPPESSEIRRRLARPVLAFETLPRIRVDGGRLLVEHPHIMNHFVPIERAVYHAIFGDDFDFITALALWGGPSLPGARGMMHLRQRLPGCCAPPSSHTRQSQWVIGRSAVSKRGEAGRIILVAERLSPG